MPKFYLYTQLLFMLPFLSLGQVVKTDVAPQVDFVWVSPAQEDVSGYQSLYCELKIESNIRLDTNSFILDVDGIPFRYDPGQKSGEDDLSEETISENVYEYRFRWNQKLDQSLKFSVIQLVVKNYLGREFKSDRRFVTIEKVPRVENISWISPEVDLVDKTYIFSKNNFRFKLSFQSNISISKEDLVFLLDRDRIELPSELEIIRGRGNEYALEGYLELKFPREEQDLQVEIKGTKSNLIHLRYVPEGKPNLFIFSVGTQSDLKYTMNDAEDFASLFKEQNKSDEVFNSVHIDLLSGPEAGASRISSVLSGYITEKRINDISIKLNDIFVFFISSHGFLDGDDLRIHGSDYNRFDIPRTTISYRDDILNKVKKLPCNKLVFVDACQEFRSGTKSGLLPSNVIVEMNRKMREAVTFMSCEKGQFSYEDEAWNNGAFTQAIVDGLSTGVADHDGNNVITVRELYDYLKNRVSNLVKEVKDADQNPTIYPDNALLEFGDKPIYFKF